MLHQMQSDIILSSGCTDVNYFLWKRGIEF